MAGTLAGLPGLTGRKAGMMSSPHGPYVQGYTRATMADTNRCKVEMELIGESLPQFGLQSATRLHEGGIASNRVSE